MKYANTPIDNKLSRTPVIAKENIEILMLVWPENYETAIHNHPEDGCMMMCLEGEVCEERYKFDEEKNFVKF